MPYVPHDGSKEIVVSAAAALNDWRAGGIQEASSVGAVSSYEEEEESSSILGGGGEKEKNWAGKAKEDVDGYGYWGQVNNACLGKSIASSWGGGVSSSPPPPIITDEDE